MGRCVEAAEGASDGLVSVRSANWGEFLGSVRADHFELIGWSLAPGDGQRQRPFDHLDLYRDIAARTLAAVSA